MRVLIAVAAVLAISPLPGSAQDEPPRPVEVLIAEFVADPLNNRDVLTMAGARCSATPGSWRRQLLDGVLALPVERVRTELIAISLSWTISHCDFESLDAWAREKLEELPDSPTVYMLVQGLGRSGDPINERAARKAIFDPRFSDRTRTNMAAAMVRDAPDPHVAALELLALGYRENGTDAPGIFLVNRMSAASGEAATAAKRELLNAVLSRPDGEGAFRMMNSIMSDVVGPGRDASDPWFQEVGRAVRAIARGDYTVSPELRSFAAERVGRFGGDGRE